MNDAGNALSGGVGGGAVGRGRDLDLGEICGVVDGEVEGDSGEDDEGAGEEEGEDGEGYEERQPAARHSESESERSGL